MVATRWRFEIFNGRNRIKENPMVSDPSAEKLKRGRAFLLR
jgi:hypothetical protein